MTDDEQPLTTIDANLARLRDALNAAVDGDFAGALHRLGAALPGPTTEVDQAARALIGDYRTLVAQHSFAIDEFLAAKHELHRKLDTIQQQHAAIQKLSAPIIDVWDGVVTVPLSGDIDSAYAEELAARLLARIERSRVAWVIVDLTGAAQLDTQLANHLLQLSRAIRLMGAQCLVTGIGPQAAQTLVSLGVSLEGLRPLASLRDGLKFCLSRSAAPTI
jgi:rsbT co-antagonist protein RsbR